MITPNQSHNLAKNHLVCLKKKNDVYLKDLVISSCGAKGTLIVNLTRLLAMVQLGTYIYIYVIFFSNQTN